VRAVIICLGLTLPAASSDLPESLAKRAASSLLFGLSPGGVYLAAAVAGGTVSSYLAFSPLPPSRRRCIFCGTFLGVTPTGRYPAPCPMEPGLSSCALRAAITPSPLPSLQIEIVQREYNTEKQKGKAGSLAGSRPEIRLRRTAPPQGSMTRLRASLARRSASRFSSRLTCSKTHPEKCRDWPATSRASDSSSRFLIR
jgi:hypothetical protein